MGHELSTAAVAKAYDRWAPVYDMVFGPVFEKGRQAAIEAADRVGGRILEVGVGTGISLPLYARTSRLVGVDISDDMLEKARRRVAKQGLTNVESLATMDAEHLAFPDESFDVVVAQYVVTAVRDPEATLDEFARVVKPGGEIILLSRVGADAGLRRAVEHSLTPLAARLGWRTQFPWARYERWVSLSPNAFLIERRPMPPLGHFSLIRFGRRSAKLS